MKLFENYEGWTDLLPFSLAPAVTIGMGVPTGLRRIAHLRELLKLQLRAAIHPAHTRVWLALLNSHPALAEYVRNCPRLVQKIYRPYLTANLDIGDRLAMLTSHYRFILRHGIGNVVAQATRGPVILGSTQGKSGKTYQIHLRAVQPMEREGELVMQLVEGDALVYSAAFTFSDRDGFGIVSIGCIQGPKDGDGRTAIRDATRDLHGMRPKQLLVSLVRQLGYELGCAQLRLVGNANRVVRSAIRQGRVLADYDQLWGELGAEQRPDADFQLPCARIAKLDLEQICSKKRSEARKRHQLTVNLADEVTRAFCARPPFDHASNTELPARLVA